MKKKILFAGVTACALLALSGNALKAQKADTAAETTCSSAELEARLNEFQSKQEKTLKEINAKLDKIMENQDKIFKELEVVKIRATVRP